jgi:uncharacterized membrane protein
MDDKQMDESISNILRAGVSLAALLVLLGGVAYLGSFGSHIPNYTTFRPSLFHTGVPRSGRDLIETGLLILILTPVIRVIFSVFAFARERDTTYVVITLIVLALLALGWFTGHAA